MKNPVAFKEWAAIVDRLGDGSQILILRKGGIHERSGGFEVEHRGFYLFPTLFHQQRESIVESARRRCDEVLAARSDASSVRLEFWAEVAESRWVVDWNQVARLHGEHVWMEEVVKDRFGWGKREGIHVIALRVFRVAQPGTIPILKEYGGCKSWIELQPDAAPALAGKRPVLDDSAFGGKLDALQPVFR